ncbi:hypothetical protein LEP1GSC188_3760 [Leptospira weilii serovar Topaz str. LT2116]|uniref:Uncharacterized protein n=1 Tax=Leptospira weilii serovar Topaz str. LT2116 TaxID=1088540 RepID=M3GVT9_9LEPT|nr:hypothetical protein LEP1GSC188_3760 [Leptospira weilii serovar Topaz str. LT2116]
MNIKKKQTKQKKTAKPDTNSQSDKNKKTDLREDLKDFRKTKLAGKSSDIFDLEPVP